MNSSSKGFDGILPRHKIQKLIVEWLEEDIPSFDWGAQAVGDATTTATLYAKSKVKIADYFVPN